MSLIEKDYLEIIDSDKECLMNYSKAELIDLAHQLAAELHDMERKFIER